MGILGTAIIQHIDSVTVNSCGSSQQIMSELLLGHIVQYISQTAIGLDVALGNSLRDDFLSEARIVLNQTNNIRLVDIAQNSGFNLRNDNLNVLLQQGVAVIGTNFGDGVGVIFQALDDHLAGVAVGFHGDEVGGIGLGFHMIGHIVDTLCLVQLGLDEVVVGIIVDDELNIGEVALAVAEQLGQIDAVGV